MSGDKSSTAIIQAAVEAVTAEDAFKVNELIKADVGRTYQRPVGDRWNNHGMLSSSGSYEYKALEPVTNQQDSVLERLAAGKYQNLADVPFGTPDEAAKSLLGEFKYQETADMMTVTFRESDPPTRKNKRLTIVYRDEGCGMEPEQIPGSIFAVGAGHKTETRWQQGAFGMGGTSTYRNAQAVVLVTRRAAEMRPLEDRISVAVIEWMSLGKGQSALYLTTADWADGENPAAEPWSAPAEVYPEFQPGTHLALVSYGVEGFHRARSGDERSFDTVLNTRLYRPVAPVRFTNEVTRGKNEYLRGLNRRLTENPSSERQNDEEEMLFTYDGESYRLPVRYVVFPGGSTGTRRRFVAKDHALVFTSNGQVHDNWTPAQLRHRTKLTKIHERVFVEIETDPLPIELRTTLFTPDRSQLLANDLALQLEDQVADFLATWDRLVEINNQLVRDAISGAGTGRSAIDVANKIAAAMKIKGFGLGGTNGGSSGPGGGGRRPRRKVETYPDPTALEGPDHLEVEDGKVRRFPYMLNAKDDFFDSGRGELKFECDHPEISVQKNVVVGRLRDGYVRVQLQVPEGAAEGDFTLTARLQDWHRAAGGLGAEMAYETKLQVVDEVKPPKTGAGKAAGGKGAGGGASVAVLWRNPNNYETDEWHNGVPGTVDLIPAATLAEKVEEYKSLEALGEQKVPTIVLNEEYGPFKSYISLRAKDLSEKGLDDSQDRYAVGVGLGLLLLNEESEKREAKAKQLADPRMELAAKKAVARSVLVMMPAFDNLIREAGLAES